MALQVGGKGIVTVAAVSCAEGFLTVQPDDEVEIHVVGEDDCGAGWLFVSLFVETQGWIPEECVAPRTGAVAIVTAEAVSCAEGYLAVQPDDEVKILFVGENDDEAGWLFVSRVHATQGWIPEDCVAPRPCQDARQDHAVSCMSSYPAEVPSPRVVAEHAPSSAMENAAEEVRSAPPARAVPEDTSYHVAQEGGDYAQ